MKKEKPITRIKKFASTIIEKIESNIYSFWTLQISGWVVFFIVTCLHFYLYPHIQFERIQQLLFNLSFGFLLTIFLRFFYRMIYKKSLSVFSLTLIVGVTSLITANIWFWPSRAIYFSIFREDLTWLSWVSKITPGDLVFRILRDSIIIAGWSGLYFAIKFWKDWKLQEEMTEKANVLAQKAQLQMLRYQLNPHFLFNSLNSIRALIAEDKKNAKAMITELSEFLRYSLISKNYSEVPLSNEIEAVRHYFAVEKVRYEEKLDVAFEIDPLAEDYPIISFIIHPLAENAIKYGMRTSTMPLKIQINAKVHNSALDIEVCNSGKWVEPTIENTNNKFGTGTGLANVRRRLENAYPNSHRFDIYKDEERVHIKLTINKKIRTKDEKEL